MASIPSIHELNTTFRGSIAGKSSLPIVIALCSFIITFSLVFGVGFASHTILRHVIQTLPCWIAIALGLRRSRATGWAAFPVFLFWLAIVVLIWSYLLGISHIVSGHFSRVEIAMTILIGIAAIVGIASFVRLSLHFHCSARAFCSL